MATKKSMLSKENLEYIATYFQRNYFQGMRVKLDDDSQISAQKIQGLGSGSLIDWKNRRLREIKFYDSHNFRIESDIEKAPPRILLREESAQKNGSITEGHLEFKAYIQDKHEQDTRGLGTSKFLSSEQRKTEEESAIDTEDKLVTMIQSLLERELLSNDSIEEGRQISLIREIIGRKEPDLDWFTNRGGDKYHGTLTLSGGLLDRRNIVSRISRHVVRTLISCSKNSVASDREVYSWMALEVSPSQEGNRMLDYADTPREESRFGLVASDEDIEDSIKSQFQSSGDFDAKLFRKHLENRGQKEEEFRKNRKNELTIRNLLENEIKPPEERMRIDIFVAGIKWLPLLGSMIAETIIESRDRMLEICDSNFAEVKLDDSKFGLDDRQKKDLGRIRKVGFGGTKGIKKEVRDNPEKVIKHNAMKLAYNIKNILIGEGLLRTRKMTSSEYKSYFLNDDESLVKSRQGKKWPGVLVFTSEFKSLIGDSEYDSFSKKSENPIFRWIKMPRNRWMYCPPKSHRISNGSLTPGGLLHPSLSRTVANVSDYEQFEVLDRMNSDGTVKSKTSRCEPNEELVEALNALQETQWEINLDLLQVICEFDLVATDTGKLKKYRGDLRDKRKDGLIHKISPRKEFAPAFYDDDSQEENELRDLVLDWIRMIIEHNANVFWHSWVCDFRGRMLPRCSELSPHDGDFGRSLIRFKEWKPVGDSGIRWLKIHLHNLMEGVEVEGLQSIAKKGRSFDERVEWVDNSEEVLREIARDPTKHLASLKLERRRYGRREDFQRLAALIEFNRLNEEFSRFGDWSMVKSGLPIHLDASCNGYQHVSSLLRIEELAELVNVSKSESGPNDLYQKVADVAKELGEGDLRDFLEGISLNEELIEQVIDGVFDRSVAKKPTMVRVYGGDDVAKGLEGRRGRGRPDFSMPMARNYSKRQIENLAKIPSDFKKAYNEYLDSDGGLRKSHFMQYSLNERTGAPSKKKGERWEKLLRPEAERRLWAPGSSMYDVIIEPGGDLADFFEYKDGEGDGWIHQQEFTDLMKDIYRQAISKVTGKAYDELERVMSHAAKNSDALWPGITWEVLPQAEGSGKGYLVNQYYIRRHGANDSRSGIPCHRGSTYNGLLPSWYSDKEYNGNKNEKSTSRLMARAVELYSGDQELGFELREWLSKGRWDAEKMSMLLDKVDPDSSNHEAIEIRNLMDHKDYSVQVYDDDEKKRIHRKKVSSSISPNFIHSLDAYHMRSVIRKFAKITAKGGSILSFWAVHDAFGTHACDIHEMRSVVIDAFRELHGSRTLAFWIDEIQWVGKQDSPILDPKLSIGRLWEDDDPELSEYLIS